MWSPLSKNSISASSGRQKENPIEAGALHTPTHFFLHYALLDDETVVTVGRVEAEVRAPSEDSIIKTI